MNFNHLFNLRLATAFFVLLASGCSGDTQASADPPHEIATATKGDSTPHVPLLDHDTLRAWKPNDSANGFGAEILIRTESDQLTEAQLMSLIRQLAGNHDPVVIRAFTSSEAYAAEQSETYGPPYAEGYLLYYVKNGTGRGPYAGRNEVRWMQESGQFAGRFGEVTSLK